MQGKASRGTDQCVWGAQQSPASGYHCGGPWSAVGSWAHCIRPYWWWNCDVPERNPAKFSSHNTENKLLIPKTLTAWNSGVFSSPYLVMKYSYMPMSVWRPIWSRDLLSGTHSMTPHYEETESTKGKHRGSDKWKKEQTDPRGSGHYTVRHKVDIHAVLLDHIAEECNDLQCKHVLTNIIAHFKDGCLPDLGRGWGCAIDRWQGLIGGSGAQCIFFQSKVLQLTHSTLLHPEACQERCLSSTAKRASHDVCSGITLLSSTYLCIGVPDL